MNSICISLPGNKKNILPKVIMVLFFLTTILVLITDIVDKYIWQFRNMKIDGIWYNRELNSKNYLAAEKIQTGILFKQVTSFRCSW